MKESLCMWAGSEDGGESQGVSEAQISLQHA
jgi:hypothetical protein